MIGVGVVEVGSLIVERAAMGGTTIATGLYHRIFRKKQPYLKEQTREINLQIFQMDNQMVSPIVVTSQSILSQSFRKIPLIPQVQTGFGVKTWRTGRWE